MKKISMIVVMLLFVVYFPFCVKAEEKTPTIEIFVGRNQECQTITQAIQKAERQNKPSRIIIEEGIYFESVCAFHSPQKISFVGNGKVVIISDDKYPYAALYCAGEYDFENITFVGMDEECYAVHIEYAGLGNEGEGNLRFSHCNFLTKYYMAVGIGTGFNTCTTFEHCNFIAYNFYVPALFAHNSQQPNTQNQSLIFQSCYFNTDIRIVDVAFVEELQNSKLSVLFQDCEIEGQFQYSPDLNQIEQRQSTIPEEQDISVTMINCSINAFLQ